MRKIKILVMAFVATAVGLTSCNKNDSGNSGVTSGDESFIKVSVNFPKGKETKATFDNNAKTGEADIHNVVVFIFNGDGVGIYEKHELLLPAAFDTPTNGGTTDDYTMEANTKIATTTGNKKVFVGVNLSTAIIDQIKLMNATQIATTGIDVSRAEMTTLANGLPMFSQIAAQTVTDNISNPGNNFSISVKRAVGKVVVDYNSSTLVTTGANGILSDWEFAINNFNKKLIPVEGAAPFKDANWNSWAVGDFDLLTATSPFASILNTNGMGVVTPNDYNPLYSTENTSQSKTDGDGLTQIDIRAKFVPAKQHKYDGTTLTVVQNGDAGYIAAPATFWTLKDGVGGDTYYFYTESEADAYKTAVIPAAQKSEYKDGYCYWYVFPNRDAAVAANKYDFLRNEVYSIRINSVVAPGRPGPPAIVDPTVPADIKVDVKVENWVVTPVQVEDLRP